MISSEARELQATFVSLATTAAVSLQERRAASGAWSRLGRAPAEMTHAAVDAGGVAAEWVAVPGARSDRVLVYVHGGSYTLGSPATHRHLVGHLVAASGCRALSLDYRLAPEHPFPAALDDVASAVDWLTRTQGIAPEQIVLAGDSAGGGLVLGTLLLLRERGRPLPAGAVALSPATDLTLSADSLRTRAALDPLFGTGRPAGYGQRHLREAFDLFLGGAAATDPLASPLLADLTGLPPLLIHVGDHELIRDDSTRFAAAARAAGVDVTLVVWPELHHVFHMSAGLIPEADAAIAEIGAWVRERLG